MTLVLIILVIVNSLVKPYSNYKSNVTATFSYAANLGIAVLNVFKTCLVTFDCKSNCSFQTTVLWYLDLAEKALLSYIPGIVIAAWFVYRVVQKCVPKN